MNTDFLEGMAQVMAGKEVKKFLKTTEFFWQDGQGSKLVYSVQRTAFSN